MSRPFALLTGFAMLLVGQAEHLMPIALFRQDLRFWATGVSGALDAMGPPCKVVGGGLLLGLLLTIPSHAGFRERVVAPSALALSLWALAAPYRAGMDEILTAALLWVLWGLGSLWRQSGGSALTPGRVLGAGFLLMGLEGTLRRSTLGPVWSALERECAPDPLRAFLLWSVLASAVLVLGLALTFRKARWPLALLGSGLLALVPLGLPRWQVPDAGSAPRDLVWLSGGPPYARLGITFPVAWPSAAPKTLREAQDRAVLAGDERAQLAVWQAVLATRPLSLGLSANELSQQIWWAQDHGQPTDALLAYLPEEERGGARRLEVAGRLGSSTQPSVGFPLRLVSSSSGLQAVDRLSDLESYRRAMWLSQPDKRMFFRLLPCPAAQTVTTDKEGRFRFRYAQRGTWSMLAGVKSTEVRDDVPHWPPLEVRESVSDLQVRYFTQRVLDEPTNLDLVARLAAPGPPAGRSSSVRGAYCWPTGPRYASAWMFARAVGACSG